MTKTHRKAATSSEDSFNRHYAGIWGDERWQDSLLSALQKPTRYACMLNRYSSLEAAKQCVSNPDTELRPLPLPRVESKNESDLPSNCFVKYKRATEDSQTASPSSESFPAPEPSGVHLQTHWNLDAASLLVAHLLNVQHGDHVLDLCAAPGGKSIALSQNIWQHLHADDSPAKQRAMQQRPLRVGTLHSNEADGPRQRRLAANLQGYLPKALFDSRDVTALRVDGTNSKAEYELRVKTASGTVGYDKVLVDAPCSSERHIIQAHIKAKAGGRVADEMANWRPGSSKRLAETQLKLLMAGLKAVRLGGTVVYATCSVEPTENDSVIEKMLSQVEKERKKGAKWSVKVGFNEGRGNEELEAELIREWAEKTKHGWIVLPDHSSGGGWGPLFFAFLTKVPS
ncbi:tRNA (cytosine(34)-C(5))-methyltransferase, mitochondrial [Pseudocercospora fuligena]|uniref:NOL1/NOP2/Sun domain family member 4 n=1 Tax=Pseudocercospora fuligena TaxID=685502 RepID=A0A8H6RVI9_9PEZI|nr:tRNA (cytosine(34)-C(5))-methyltransferase, mitochondrial [Pseudocercospora fuligena]